MAQMYVFTGENEYRMHEEARRWIMEFARKYGDDTIMSMDGSDVTVRDLLDEVAVMPFLSERRLVVVHGMVRCFKEEATVLVNAIHPNVLLLFIDQKPDKRSAGIKELLSLADVRTYAVTKGAALRTWIRGYLQSMDARMHEDAQQLLFEYVGEDQGLTAEELQKLATYAGMKIITIEDVELLSIPSDEGIIWKISDLLCSGSREQALIYAKRMLDRGGDPQNLWAILLSMLKNIVAVYAATQEGLHSPKDIADATGVNIFAARSLMAYAKKLSDERIRSFLQWAANTNIALKTGALRATDEAQQEILSAIDAFIMKTP